MSVATSRQGLRPRARDSCSASWACARGFLIHRTWVAQLEVQTQRPCASSAGPRSGPPRFPAARGAGRPRQPGAGRALAQTPDTPRTSGPPPLRHRHHSEQVSEDGASGPVGTRELGIPPPDGCAPPVPHGPSLEPSAPGQVRERRRGGSRGGVHGAGRKGGRRLPSGSTATTRPRDPTRQEGWETGCRRVPQTRGSTQPHLVQVPSPQSSPVLPGTSFLSGLRSLVTEGRVSTKSALPLPDTPV